MNVCTCLICCLFRLENNTLLLLEKLLTKCQTPWVRMRCRGNRRLYQLDRYLCYFRNGQKWKGYNTLGVTVKTTIITSMFVFILYSTRIKVNRIGSPRVHHVCSKIKYKYFPRPNCMLWGAVENNCTDSTELKVARQIQSCALLNWNYFRFRCGCAPVTVNWNFVVISPCLRYLRTLYIVWSLMRRRVTRRLTRLQTMHNVLENSKTI